MFICFIDFTRFQCNTEILEHLFRDLFSTPKRLAMHKLLETSDAATNSSVLIELSLYFGEAADELLFTKVHLWYYAQVKTRQQPVEDEALDAYSKYQESGVLPVFFKIADTILKARKELPEDRYDDYSRGNAPKFWACVFSKFYMEDPVGNNDGRWSELFRIGMPIYRKFEEEG